MNTLNAIENLQRQLRISDVLDVLMAQSLQLLTTQTKIVRQSQDKQHGLTNVDIGLLKLEIV